MKSYGGRKKKNTVFSDKELSDIVKELLNAYALCTLLH